MRILWVEDDEWIAEPLIEALVDQHYVRSSAGWRGGLDVVADLSLRFSDLRLLSS
jgi:DNA-binding response OmpR family regulator